MSGSTKSLYSDARRFDRRLAEEPPDGEDLPPDWYADFTEGNSFVISGLLGLAEDRLARNPGEISRRMPTPEAARTWCEERYGRIIGSKKNLVQGSGRWAYRVPKPQQSSQEEK